jgi:uncharacterized protein YjbI with pentapeptide repeats
MRTRSGGEYLRDAKLRNANLKDTNLKDADLRGAKKNSQFGKYFLA